MLTLIRQSRDYCDQIVATNPFFKSLAGGEMDDLEFAYQLRLWCVAFIDCLFLASARCPSKRFKKMRRQHAIAEGDHPDQLDKWMEEHGLTKPLPAMTPEGRELLAFVRQIAGVGSAEHQVLILNVLLEYLALVTFSALIKRLGTTVLNGRYWHVHEEVDDVHSMMGTDLVTPEWLEENRPAAEQVVERGAYLANRWLASLVPLDAAA